MTNLLERFFSRVQLPDDPTDCWVWTGGATPAGYGHMKVGDKATYVYRLLYEAINGPIPAGMQMDHMCRNPRCVSPWHVEPVTPSENKIRGEAARRPWKRRTKCVNGHPWTEENTFEYRTRTRQSDGQPVRGCLTCRREAGARRREKRRAEASGKVVR